jgi:hypothetical protein
VTKQQQVPPPAASINFLNLITACCLLLPACLLTYCLRTSSNSLRLLSQSVDHFFNLPSSCDRACVLHLIPPFRIPISILVCPNIIIPVSVPTETKRNELAYLNQPKSSSALRSASSNHELESLACYYLRAESRVHILSWARIS